MLQDRSPASQARQVQHYAGAHMPGVEVSQVELERLEDLSGDFQVRYKAVLTQLGRRIAHLLLVRIPWTERLEGAGPYSVADRPEPLAVPLHTIQERHEITVPAGHNGIGLPYQCSEDSEWARYRAMIVLRDGVLRCERIMVFRGGVVPPARFPEIRAFYQKCSKIDTADIVFERKE
jgi:hypothetical protein